MTTEHQRIIRTLLQELASTRAELIQIKLQLEFIQTFQKYSENARTLQLIRSRIDYIISILE